MKKLFLLPVLVISFLVSFIIINKPAQDVIADKKNINLFINGVEVESYNNDGKTLVLLDDITEHYDEINQYSNCKYVGFYEGKHPKANPSHNKYKAFSRDKLVSKSTHREKNKNEKPKNQIKKVSDNGICVYNKEIPDYDIDGKIAVAIEDLADEQKFSDIGGKYILDKENNIINLELMHDNRELLSERKMDLDLKINDEQTKIIASAKRENLNPGMISYSNFKEFYPGIHDWGWSKMDHPSLIIPIFTQINGSEKQIGYYFVSWCSSYIMELAGGYNDVENYQFAYFNDIGALDELNKSLPEKPRMGIPAPVYEEFLKTDDCVFYYLPGSDYMVRVDNKTGAQHDYTQDFAENHEINKVDIDVAKEQVNITFDSDKHAVIDLKTGRLKIN